MRLQVDALLRDGPTGAPIRLAYTGTIKTAGTGAGKVFAGAEDAGTTGFGDGCEFFFPFPFFFYWRVLEAGLTGVVIHATFETGHPDLAGMDTKVYVGAGRFILEEGKPVVVEYKISEVAA